MHLYIIDNNKTINNMNNTYKLEIVLTDLQLFHDIKMTRFVRADSTDNAWHKACNIYTSQGFAFQATVTLSDSSAPYDII